LNLYTYSAENISSSPLPGPSAVVRMADSPSLLIPIRDKANVVASLDLVFNDTGEDFGPLRSPSDQDARAILDFVARNQGVPNMVFQCQVGVGRSLAACAAIQKVQGGDPRAALYRGTHNRGLYRKILLAAGLEPDPEELVSMVVRVKYAPDRMHAFLLCMRRQRYENWELIFVTDGPNPAAAELVGRSEDSRVKLIETERPLGRWGHPYRQRGIDAAAGEYIGLSNDDNYYVPGYIEQMVNALVQHSALLALSPIVHNYWGWQQVGAGHDIGAWIARRELVERTPWTGTDYMSDEHYLTQLHQNAGGRVTTLDRPLFVHN
jgi:hypothetical protein